MNWSLYSLRLGCALALSAPACLERRDEGSSMGGRRPAEVRVPSTTIGGGACGPGACAGSGGTSSDRQLGGGSSGGGAGGAGGSRASGAAGGGATGALASAGTHNASGGGPCGELGVEDPTVMTRFAVFGDYGWAGPAEDSVARLIRSFRPDFLVTTGDNNYPDGAAATIDANIGQYFHDFICPYRGSYGRGAAKNRFFPSLGNHDWYTAGAAPYLDYFSLPNNERYYDLLWGSVHFFMLDSDPNEPDGNAVGSRQADWVRARVQGSPARWRVAVMHHPPYSSGPHGSTPDMQWPYKDWGFNLILAGHDHDYERFAVDGLPFVVLGLGGASIYSFQSTVDGSAARFNAEYGAALIEADAKVLFFRFFGVSGTRIDEFTLNAP